MSNKQPRFALVSCTQKSNEKDTLLYKSIQKSTDKLAFDQIYFYFNNKEGLSKQYNAFIRNNASNFDFIVFAHDDVSIVDSGVIAKLTEAHRTFDIVGVAGGVNPTITEPALWHIMCGGFGKNLRGFAGHYITPEQISITNFGPTPARVAIADGVFLSVNVRAILEKNWTFNENYTFHHYDISSCLDANKKQLKIGVWPILLAHLSPGLKSLHDSTFLANQRKFIKEYKNY